MDAAALYPGGHHPVRRHYTPDGLYEVTPLPRGDRSVTYLYVDFGLSSWFPGDASPYVVGRVGRDKQAPELSSTVPYNAFKLDIFTLGNLYSQEFEQVRLLGDCNAYIADALTEIQQHALPSSPHR